MASSTLKINFSLRQNKSIERSIVFEALSLARNALGGELAYAGFGSLWFQDFQLAHKLLSIKRMFSIESSHKVYKRAEFNKPYGCIEILKGRSVDLLPELIQREELVGLSWVVWLDYDSMLDSDSIAELRHLAEILPDNSALITTFNAEWKRYALDRSVLSTVLSELFPDVADDDIDDDELSNIGFMQYMAAYTNSTLRAASISSGRDGWYVPGVSLLYKDVTRMVTAGGFLVSQGEAAECEGLIESETWPAIHDQLIESEPLTLREIFALSRLVPSETEITVDDVKKLGFEITESQLRFFERDYLHYPTFAEIASQ